MRNKVKKMFMGLALIVAMLLVSSCATRESAINDLENFSYELRDNSQYYTAKKWRKAVDKFGRIRREISLPRPKTLFITPSLAPRTI